MIKKKYEVAGHSADMGQKRNVYKFLAGKQAGRREVPRSRLKRRGKIKLGLIEIR
jgi:hypothetical protein